jgi:hypothetical protein
MSWLHNDLALIHENYELLSHFAPAKLKTLKN